jgi:hypothetical protein
MKYVAYGPWFTLNTCPSCEEPVSHDEIYSRRCCSKCGHSGAIMLGFEVTTLRRAYIRKSWIPFRSKWVYEIKDRKARFGYGSGRGGFTSSSSSLALTTMAAATIAIF